MELNRFNQLKIEETDIIHDERYDCPSCGSSLYSSMAMEKIASQSPTGNTISTDSIIGVDRVFYCKCSCGNNWLEKYFPMHHRPGILKYFMVNFKRLEK
jgi:hypothetical protein